MTNNAAEAEDLTQETFMRVFQKLATFRRDCALSSWLYRIAVNTVLMHFRKETVPQVHLDDPISQDAQIVDRAYGITDPGLSHCVERIALERAIAELPRGYRLIFLLHDLEGYAHEEIAQLLLCSPGTSKSQLHRARLRIRQLLRQRMRGMLKPGSRRSRSRADDLPRRAMTLAAGGRLRPRGR
jgi:RNA polymerase sigma-70 factor (ECF subfamily)